MLIAAPDLSGVTPVGHAMGRGEIIRYLTGHGSAHARRIVQLAPTPKLLEGSDNPEDISSADFAAE